MSSSPRPAQSGDRLKDYIPVSERIEKFYELYPDGRILTDIIEHDGERGFILMKAMVYRRPEDTIPAATGHAYEIRGEGHVNKTSYIENCETGAAGRALANLGLEVKRQPANAAPRANLAGSESQWACNAKLMKEAIDLENAASAQTQQPLRYFRDKFKTQRGHEVWNGSDAEVEPYVKWLAEKAAAF